MKSYFQKKYLICFIFGGLLQSTVLIYWNANKEKDLAGYKVYWGTHSQRYENVANAGLDTNYIVNNLEADYRYYFAVTAYDSSGNESDFSEEVSIFINSNGNLTTPPVSLKCYNFPNPFDPQKEVTRIRYYLEQAQDVTIDIFDANENLVRNLLNKVNKSSGEHTEDTWDGKNNNGYYVPNGVYYGVIRIGYKKKIIMIAIVR